MTTEDRQIHWRTIIDNQAAGGMKIAACCRESHIHPPFFHTWRSKLREQQPFAGGRSTDSGRLDDAVSGG